ncbi:COG4315 family predicted lipoprotein [Microbacterium sp. MAHUQ-60]|uniref:COG4315 family predicted lipoprotein n=1 Tax=unclassified Microbacterium TaxID=2609290 RepID=UPI0036188971
MRKALAIGGIALALLLTGCAGSTSGSSDADLGAGSDAGYGAPSSEASQPAASDSGLKVADTSLGSVVVDGDGMTAYMYDKDTQGAATSACTGACLTQWPPILSASAEPKADGVTGTLATIDTPDGKHQVTLDGWPLYTFAGDEAAGDVNGQGVGGIWWVLSPAGEKIGG